MEPVAIDQAADLLRDDPNGLRAVLAAVDDLARNPFPEMSSALGAAQRRRLRVGRYRVYFLVEPEVVRIARIGRSDRE